MHIMLRQIQSVIWELFDKEYAIKKIESQLAIEIKENKADYVVVNNDSIENVYKQIDLILQKLED